MRSKLATCLTAAVILVFGGAVLVTAEAAEEQMVTPAAYSMTEDHTQQVFYRNADGNIVNLFFKQGDTKGWHSTDITAASGGPKAAGNPGAFLSADGKSQHVVYRGADDHVHELFFTPKVGKWGHTDLTDGAKAPRAAGDPVGYALSDGKSLHVVYRTDNGAIAELYRQAEAKEWKSADITMTGGGAKAAGNPCAFTSLDGKVQHVVYRGADDQIHELSYSTKVGKWAHADLTTEAKAPKAAGDPSGYVLNDDKSLHVVYRADAGAILELWRGADAKAWSSANLTEATGGVKAAGNPCGFVSGDGKMEHVVFRGTDDNVHELFNSLKAGKWGHANLTADTKAAKADGNPVGFGTTDDKTLHVYYPAAEGAIYELYRHGEEGKTWTAVNLTDKAKSSR
jgi:hypothetical protein